MGLPQARPKRTHKRARSPLQLELNIPGFICSVIHSVSAPDFLRASLPVDMHSTGPCEETMTDSCQGGSNADTIRTGQEETGNWIFECGWHLRLRSPNLQLLPGMKGGDTGQQASCDSVPPRVRWSEGPSEATQPSRQPKAFLYSGCQVGVDGILCGRKRQCTRIFPGVPLKRCDSTGLQNGCQKHTSIRWLRQERSNCNPYAGLRLAQRTKSVDFALSNR